MADILDDLRAYLAGENRIIMSPKRINEMIAAFDGLRAELAAEKQRAAELRAWRDDATMACAKRRCSTVLRDRDEAEAERDTLRAALMSTTASLVAAVSLLERGGIKAAPSNIMFMQMLKDYKNIIDGARAAIKGAR